MGKITESEYKRSREMFDHLKSRRYELKEFDLERAKIEMKQAQQYYQYVVGQIEKVEIALQKHSEIIDGYTVENDLFPDSDKSEVYGKLKDLSKAEINFVKAVVRNPGVRLKKLFTDFNESESVGLWVNPERLGLIYPAGKYRWKAYKKTTLYFKSKGL